MTFRSQAPARDPGVRISAHGSCIEAGDRRGHTGQERRRDVPAVLGLLADVELPCVLPGAVLCRPAAITHLAAVCESGPMNAIGVSSRRTLPGLAYSTISAPSSSSKNSRQNGHCRSTSTCTSTGAFRVPRPEPFCGIPARASLSGEGVCAAARSAAPVSANGRRPRAETPGQPSARREHGPPRERPYPEGTVLDEVPAVVLLQQRSIDGKHFINGCGNGLRCSGQRHRRTTSRTRRRAARLSARWRRTSTSTAESRCRA